MMEMYLRKYGTGTGADVIIPINKAGSDDFAVGGDWTPVAGDVKVSKNGGAAANISTLPVFITGIGWKFVFSDAELTTARINVNIVDAATKAIKDRHFVVETQGHASALHNIDTDNFLASAVTKILTTQLTEAYAAKGVAPTLAQALFELLGEANEVVFTDTTASIKKRDGTTEAFTDSIDDATNPTSRHRAT